MGDKHIAAYRMEFFSLRVLAVIIVTIALCGCANRPHYESCFSVFQRFRFGEFIADIIVRYGNLYTYIRVLTYSFFSVCPSVRFVLAPIAQKVENENGVEKSKLM